MSQIIDNAIALRILTMLVKPFRDTQAYKLGIIDANGKNLISSSQLNSQQKEAYTYLDKLVFNIKKIINLLPGGETKLKNLTAGMFLFREAHRKHQQEVDSALLEKVLTRLEAGVIFVEEELLVSEFLQLQEDIANVTGAGVATNEPVIRKRPPRRIAGFVVGDKVFKNFAKGKQKYSQWSKQLDLNDPGQRTIYNFARKNPRGIIVLHNGKNTRAIRFNRRGGGSWSTLKTRKKRGTTV